MNTGTLNTKRLELKSLDEATGEFVGYCSVFGVEDQVGDVVRKGAFAKTISERGPQGIKMLFDHNPSEPIGRWMSLEEDDYGLLGRGQLLLDLEKGREVYTLMKAQVLDGLSIGYRVTKQSQDRANPHIRFLDEIDLREVSAVMFPCNEESVITSVKANQLPTEREFQRLIQREAGLSRSEAAHVLEHGFKSLLKTKRDAGGEVASTPPDPSASLLLERLMGLHDAIR